MEHPLREYTLINMSKVPLVTNVKGKTVNLLPNVPVKVVANQGMRSLIHLRGLRSTYKIPSQFSLTPIKFDEKPVIQVASLMYSTTTFSTTFWSMGTDLPYLRVMNYLTVPIVLKKRGEELGRIEPGELTTVPGLDVGDYLEIRNPEIGELYGYRMMDKYQRDLIVGV
jgi:hypothetical protein